MVEQPLEPPVGLDSSFEEVSTWVQDEGVRRIGLYDMGGVGKTTLLKKIHNEFLVKEHDYHVVAWIVVSQPTDPKKIQEHIWEKLHLPKSQWNDIIESERPGKILKIIKEKNFLIFLDDVWEEIDLLNLGIPSRNHQHKSKIIFTTRLQDVCGSMHAERTKKVECLPADKALKLFREKVGEQTWTAHVEIPNLAEAMIKECKYLPLALITVGAAMASRRCPDEWRGSIEVLKKLPSEFADMEKKRCLRELRLRWCKVWMSLIIPKPSLRTMEHLKYLQVSRCEFTEITMGKEEYGWHGETGRSDGLGSLRLPSYPEISPEISHLESQDCFRRLERIIIEDCDKLREVTVLIYHAPCLTYLRISCCESLRELIAGDVEDSHVGKILSSLIYLDLGALPELESICRGALSLPSLELLQVVKCRQLKKLPLKSSSSAHARRQFCKIRGDWECFELTPAGTFFDQQLQPARGLCCSATPVLGSRVIGTLKS
ncbi:hypothetical protein CRG98_015349 [Punica granatum]|uniref:Uncharacterized protein n=1 Tax=Punica granatum TaxID=22663 RepID=A0A2I0K6Q5_PUNGR|nr:hypothetical protein CRG98_015349 [Punica granatum]